jgi:hypothetical protein
MSPPINPSVITLSECRHRNDINPAIAHNAPGVYLLYRTFRVSKGGRERHACNKCRAYQMPTIALCMSVSFAATVKHAANMSHNVNMMINKRSV